MPEHTSDVLLEICVDSLESARAAEAGSAHRLELCANLNLGGTTPSYGLLQACLKQSKLPIMMMIRPRAGSFVYSDLEFEVMKRDVALAKCMGVQGVVFGCLSSDGNVDVQKTKELIDLARPLEVTFHRAFDVVADPFEALETLITLGIDHLLTSGQKATAYEGHELIQALVKQAAGRLSVMAGAGVSEENIAEIVQVTNVQACHASASVKQLNHHGNLKMGLADTGEQVVTSETSVRALLKCLAKGQHIW